MTLPGRPSTRPSPPPALKMSWSCMVAPLGPQDDGLSPGRGPGARTTCANTWTPSTRTTLETQEVPEQRSNHTSSSHISRVFIICLSVWGAQSFRLGSGPGFGVRVRFSFRVGVSSCSFVENHTWTAGKTGNNPNVRSETCSSFRLLCTLLSVTSES